MLQVVEHRGTGHGGVGSSWSWRTSHGSVASRTARPRVNGIRPGRRGAVLAEVEGVDLEPALEVAAQGGLGGRAVEPGVLGAALVEHGGDEALPVLATLRREAGREGMVSAAAGGSVIVVPPRGLRRRCRPGRPSSTPSLGRPSGRKAGGRSRPAPPP